MKTPPSHWRLLTALVLALSWISVTDAAEPRKRSSSPKPVSEFKRTLNSIGNFFSRTARELEERDRRDPFDDPFFYPEPPSRQFSRRSDTGTGIYPVPPGLEEYFRFRELHPYVGAQRQSTASQSRVPPPQQRQTMTFPSQSRHPYLPFYITVDGPRPALTSVPPRQYAPLTPSSAGEAPRSGGAVPNGPDATQTQPPSYSSLPDSPSSAPLGTGMASSPPRITSNSNSSLAEPKKRPVLTNLPTAKPVPGKPGFVYLPGKEEASGNMLDVRGFMPGQKVSDPRTGQIFLVP